MTNNTTPDATANRINRLREIRRTSRQLGYADISIHERDKLLREVTDDLSNLSYIIPKSTR